MRNNKLRTALTGLAVAWGIFMLITLVSVANGVTTSFKENMMRADSQQITVWGGVTTKPYHGYREGRKINLKNNDLHTLRQQHSADVRYVTSEMYGTTTNISTNTTYVESNYNGVFPSKVNQEKLDMIQGRFINENDMQTEAKVMVLPLEYAKQLFPPDGDNAVGERVTCGGLSYLIIGVYQSWNRSIYIPYTTARAFAADKDNFGQMAVVLKGVSSVEEAEDLEKGIRRTLASIHDFNPEDDSAVWIWNAVKNTLTVQGAMGILNIGVWVLGLLTLLSGIIGISNIMFVSVKERTHEIGIRRAIGARPRQILIQILAESIVITTLFGYIGIVLGTGLTELLSSLDKNGEFLSYAHVNIGIACQVTVVLIIAGALAGLFPALKALKVKPVEALRDE